MSEVEWTILIRKEVPDPKPEFWIGDEFLKVWEELGGRGFDVRVLSAKTIHDKS